MFTIYVFDEGLYSIYSPYSQFPNDESVLKIQGLGNCTTAEVIHILEAIPQHVRKLCLSYSFFYRREPEELSQIFAAIPPWIKLLDLAGNGLGLRGFKVLYRSLRVLPKDLESLELGDNFLVDKTDFTADPNFTVANLLKLTRSIPAGSTILESLGCELGYMSTSDIIKIFAKNPEGPTAISIALFFKNKTAADMERIISAIPGSVASLWLRYRYLGQRGPYVAERSYSATAEELIRTMVSIRSGVTKLRVDLDMLQDRSADENERILDSIPATVSTVEVAVLSDMGLTEIISALPRLPSRVNSLYLASAFLYLSSELLLRLFAAIPSHVTVLELTGYLPLSKDLLLGLFAAIPPHVTVFGLPVTIREIREKITDELEFEQLIGAIPNVDFIRLENNHYFSIDEFWSDWCDRLIAKVQNLILNNESLEFYKISSPIPISIHQRRFLRIIDKLKEKNSPVACFTAAMLLMERIESSIQDGNEYLIAHILEVVELLIQATAEPSIRTSAEFRLWHLKAMYRDIPEVREVLSFVKKPPKQFIQSYNFFQEGQSSEAEEPTPNPTVLKK